jgi:hypothetical protein
MRLCETFRAGQDTAGAQIANAPEVRMIIPVVRRRGAAAAGTTYPGL